MDGRKFSKISLLFFAPLFWLFQPNFSHAAVIELSAMFAYTKSDYADGYKSLQRRYTGSMDFKFTSVSSLQFEYTDSVTESSYLTNIGTIIVYNTKVSVRERAKIYSFNWVQNLVPSKWLIQPYILFGGGRMDRSYKQDFPEFPGNSFEFKQRVTSGTAGAGLRVFLTKNMAIKSEVKTYVPDFRFSKWKENQLMSVGLSWLF